MEAVPAPITQSPPVDASSTPDVGRDATEHGEGDAPSRSKEPRQSLEETYAPGTESRAELLRQVEYYFSDTNLPTDAFLLGQTTLNPEGYVLLSVILKFKRLKKLRNRADILAATLDESSTLQLSEDRLSVRRKEPIPKVDLHKVRARTVLLTPVPEKTSIESIHSLCAPFGEVGFSRIRHHPDTDPLVANLKSFRSVQASFALVEFATPAQAEAAARGITAKSDWRSGYRASVLKPLVSKRAAPRSRVEEASLGAVEGSSAPARASEELQSAASVERPRFLWKPQKPSKVVPAEDKVEAPATRKPTMPDGSKGFTMSRTRGAEAATLADLISLGGS